MSTANRVIKNTAFLYCRMIISILVSVFTTRILLNALGASDYGLYSVVLGALSMLGFISASMSSTTQRFISYAEGQGHNEEVKKIFNNSLYLHWCIAILIGLLFVIFGFFLFNYILNIPAGREITSIIVYGCLIISMIFSIIISPYDALLNAHENMKYYSILGIFDVILKFIIALGIMYSSGDRLLIYGILMALEAWMLRFITQRYCLKHYSECRDVNIKKYLDKALLKKMSSFTGWYTVNLGTALISLHGMGIVINHFFTTIVNAALGIATQLAGVMMGVTNNMTKSLTPILVKNEGANNRKATNNISLIGCKFSYLLYSFICIPVLFYTPDVLKLWLGDIPEWSVLFCRLMILSNLIEQLYNFLLQSILAQGDVRNFHICRSFFNILPIIVSSIEFALGWSPYWILINWILFFIITGAFITLYYVKKNCGIDYNSWIINVLVPCISVSIASSIIFYVSLQILTSTLLGTLFKILIAIMLCTVTYWFIGLTSSEKSQLYKIIQKLLHKKQQ